MGVSRAVNIIETTYSDANYDNHWILVYDKISGITLEFGFEVTQKTPTPTTTKAAYSVTETNLFTSAEPTQSPEETTGLESSNPTKFNLLPIETVTVIAMVAIVVFIIAAITLFLKKRK